MDEDFRVTRIEHIQIFDSIIIPENHSTLVVFELYNLILSLKRFFIVDVEEEQNRGAHAHKLANQIFYLLAGKIELTLEDGYNKKKIEMERMGSAIVVPRGIWASQKYYSQSSLLVLTDTIYDENEYIRDFSDFLNAKRGL